MNQFSRLSDEDLRNMCVTAHKHDVSLHFLDHNVAEAQWFEFELVSGEKEIHFAIPCPTLPRLYLSSGNTENEVKLIRVRSFIENYDFNAEGTKAVSVVRGKLL